MLKVAIIADDLTGAMDTAGPFAAAGLKTLVRFDADYVTADLPSDLDILCCTTQTRHFAADAAAARVADALRALSDTGPKLLLKKVDTTLRGNIAAEIAAAMHASGRRHLLIAPAAPAQGRIMRNGEVFVHGIPLRESDAARDARSPAASLPLAELLRGGIAGLTTRILSRDASLTLTAEGGPQAYLADAQTDADLDRVAEFALRHSGDILLVGATGIGAALARHMGGHTDAPLDLSPVGKRGRVMFVIGSRTAVTAGQLARLRAAGAAEVVVPIKRDAGDPLTIPPLTVSTPLILRPEAAGQVRADDAARVLAQAAVSLIGPLDVCSLVLSGGDTAAAVFSALGVRECMLLGEIMPGIPVGCLAGAQRSLCAVTKSGGYGDADTLLRIAEGLEAALPRSQSIL
ncbi:MAG TPA: four-carbon acid sugar kinase family protein [Pseudolabrys sp.]|nr:four-carbon acid sugar kinase family protein [Pseudolabrys sp.]